MPRLLAAERDERVGVSRSPVFSPGPAVAMDIAAKKLSEDEFTELEQLLDLEARHAMGTPRRRLTQGEWDSAMGRLAKLRAKAAPTEKELRELQVRQDAVGARIKLAAERSWWLHRRAAEPVKARALALAAQFQMFQTLGQRDNARRIETATGVELGMVFVDGLLCVGSPFELAAVGVPDEIANRDGRDWGAEFFRRYVGDDVGVSR